MSRQGLRRQGAAQALLEAAFAKAALFGAKEIFLEVRESNHSAVRLYQKLGFAQAGVRRQFYSHPAENALVMRREILQRQDDHRCDHQRAAGKDLVHHQLTRIPA